MSDSCHERGRSVDVAPLRGRKALLLGAGVLAWIAAAYVLQVFIMRGPAQQAIDIRWAAGADDLQRRAAERVLKLRDGEELEPGRWAYRLQDQSRESIRAIVTHPLVADTGHVNRERLQILLDAPSVPAPLRRVLEARLGPLLITALTVLGLAGCWPVRRDLATLAARTVALPGFDLFVAAAALTTGFVLFLDNGHSVDENVHYDQIVRFAHGDWSLNPALTTIPGFHAVAAALALLLGGAGPASVRTAVFAISLVTVATFHALARTLHPSRAGAMTLQFTLFPIRFPQFFLIYTDVASLLFVLAMMLAAVRRRPVAAGLLGLLACLVRQDDVMWVAFALAWSYLRDAGWAWQPIRTSLSRYWAYIATGLAFVLFVAANGGEAALGNDVGSHPLGSIHVSNVYLLLFLAGVFFLPAAWSYRARVRELLGRPWLWFSLAVLAAVFGAGFRVDHPHNVERAEYFMTNALLLYVSSSPVRKAAFLLIAAAGLVWVAASPVPRPWRLLYPFAILFLLPEWLVTPRYDLIPLSLFLAAREPGSAGAERAQTMLFAAGSIAVFLVMERGRGWL